MGRLLRAVDGQEHRRDAVADPRRSSPRRIDRHEPGPSPGTSPSVIAQTAYRPLPTPIEIRTLAHQCATTHPDYGDFVLLSALLAARVSEVSGLAVGDIDWDRRLVTIARQLYPGAGGMSIKPPKNGLPRAVPILDAVEPTLRRLTADRSADEPLLRGPRGGAITTAALREATRWDQRVTDLGYPGLRRYDLRHIGATWFANAGIPLHTVQSILGHASIETTTGYLHSDTDALRQAAATLNALIQW